MRIARLFARDADRVTRLSFGWEGFLVDLSKDGRVTILHLSDKTCKWPIGDPGSEEFCFCGHGPREGSPYCEYHARLAYQPMQDRRNRKVNFG